MALIKSFKVVKYCKTFYIILDMIRYCLSDIDIQCQILSSIIIVRHCYILLSEQKVSKQLNLEVDRTGYPDLVRCCYIVLDIVRYCQILSDSVRQCKILSEIIRHCQILSDIRYCCKCQCECKCKGVQRVSGGCLQGVQRVSVRCLEGASGGCLECVWKVY